MRFDIGAMPMHEALSNAIVLMEPQAAAKGDRVSSTHCDPDIVAQADRERVQQVVLNLLSNAVKYTQEGGEVRIKCVQDGRTVRVRVSDTGRGIAAGDVHRIFDPFVQLPGGGARAERWGWAGIGDQPGSRSWDGGRHHGGQPDG